LGKPLSIAMSFQKQSCLVGVVCFSVFSYVLFRMHSSFDTG
ncbi:18283_t:CDS:1, partial [Gigaspora rosea]